MVVAQRLFLGALLGFFAGCAQSTAIPPSKVSAHPEIDATARSHIAAWTSMGMWLPDASEISFFHENLDSVHDVLVSALRNEDSSVRQRAAYVIGEIGPQAATCGPDLIKRLKVENDRLVRIYLIDAIREIRFASAEARDELARRFDALDSANTPPSPRADYADVDERICVASAMYELSEPADRERYLNFVVQWLNPPPDDMAKSEVEGYWERRWMAVISLEHMDGATSAIPLLEKMLEEKGSEMWVGVHVPRVLRALAENDVQ